MPEDVERIQEGVEDAITIRIHGIHAGGDGLPQGPEAQCELGVGESIELAIAVGIAPYQASDVSRDQVHATRLRATGVGERGGDEKIDGAVAVQVSGSHRGPAEEVELEALPSLARAAGKRYFPRSSRKGDSEMLSRFGRYSTPLFLLGVLCLATVPGCSWNRQRINVVQFHDKVAGIEVGKTTRAELESMIGTPPNSILNTPAGNQILVYSYGDGKTEVFSLILVTWSKTNLGIDSALFLVDPQGIVQGASIGTNSQDLPWEWWPFGEA